MKKTLLLLITGLLFLSTLTPAAASFRDVQNNSPYGAGIEYLEKKGVVTGTVFHPNATMTRGDFALWILKNSGFTSKSYLPKTIDRFSDVDLIKEKRAAAIYKLLDLGVISMPADRLFRPNAGITKLDAISWLFNLEGIPQPKFFDVNTFSATDVDVDSSQAPLVSKALELGILSRGAVNMNRKISRGAAAEFIKNLAIGTKQQTITVQVLPNSTSGITANPRFKVTDEVWSRIHNNYLRRSDVDEEKLIYGSIEGMVKELGDKHTVFERPGDNAVVDSLSGQVEGIGAILQLQDEKVVVVTPIPDSPAERAGLQANDVITAVDGTQITKLSLSAVVAKIKGKKGTQVTLSIQRNGEKKEITVTRDVVQIVSVSMKQTTDNIAVVKITNFGEKTSREFAETVKKVKEIGAKSLVIDLRNNPGGYLSTAIDLVGYFIKSGELVATVRYPTRSEAENASGTGELSTLKVMILMNAGSASASEILAGALQDYGIAKVVGEKSYGKGTVQELMNFSDGSTLKLTIAEWLTPKGRIIEKSGITPDFEVGFSDAERKLGADPQLDRALQELRK